MSGIRGKVAKVALPTLVSLTFSPQFFFWQCSPPDVLCCIVGECCCCVVCETAGFLDRVCEELGLPPNASSCEGEATGFPDGVRGELGLPPNASSCEVFVSCVCDCVLNAFGDVASDC